MSDRHHTCLFLLFYTIPHYPIPSRTALLNLVIPTLENFHFRTYILDTILFKDAHYLLYFSLLLWYIIPFFFYSTYFTPSPLNITPYSLSPYLLAPTAIWYHHSQLSNELLEHLPPYYTPRIMPTISPSTISRGSYTSTTFLSHLVVCSFCPIGANASAPSSLIYTATLV